MKETRGCWWSNGQIRVSIVLAEKRQTRSTLREALLGPDYVPNIALAIKHKLRTRNYVQMYIFIFQNPSFIISLNYRIPFFSLLLLTVVILNEIRWLISYCSLWTCLWNSDAWSMGNLCLFQVSSLYLLPDDGTIKIKHDSCARLFIWYLK